MIAVLVSGSGCTKRMRTRRALAAADRDFNENKYDDAEVEYKSVLRLDGLNPTAIGQLGRMYAKEGKLIDAHRFLSKATELQPNSLPFQLALGQVEVAFRENTNAFQIAVRILSAQPTNEEALLLLVDSASSVPEVRQLLQKMPHAEENRAYHLALGILAMRQQKYDNAGSEFRLAVAADPKSSQAYFSLAGLHVLRKENAEAAQAFKTAATVAPLRSLIRSKYIDFLIKSGHVEDGRKMLQEVSEKTPDYLPAWVGLMNLALMEKKFVDAAKYANIILARDDKNFEGLMGLGNVSLASGDAARAVTQFEHMESLYKRSPQVKYYLAAALLVAHDRVQGMESLNQALTLDPGYAQAVQLLAELDIRSGDPGAAVALLTRFIKKSPGASQAHMLLADAYLAERQPENALIVYRNLEEALPKEPQIPLLIGAILAAQHKDGEARAAFKQSLALAPDYTLALEQLINLDIAQHNYPDATALVQAQVNKTPKAAVLWQLQAKIDLAGENSAGAEKDLLKAIEMNPDLSTPYLLLAQTYVRSGKNDEALQKLNALVKRTNDPTAYLEIAAIHEQLKQYATACDSYEKVLSINSNSAPALNNLSYLYAAELNKIDLAYPLAQRARVLLPNDANVGDTLGWILFKKGDYSHAVALLEESADRSPADGEVQYHLGMAHYMLDEEDSARLALQRAVASRDDYVGKNEATNRLAVLNMDTATTNSSVLSWLEKTLHDRPNDPVVLYRIGAFQEHTGAVEKAATTYEKALKLNSEDVPVMVKLARIYALRLNQPDEALRLATAAHKLAPDNADAAAILGHLAYRNSHSNEESVWALSLLESAADRLSDQPDLLYDLAWAYYSVGRIADAETTMQKALQLGVGLAGSEDAKRFMALADSFGSSAKVQATVGQAQQILRTDSKYVPAIMVSGAAAENAGNFTAAQDAYSKALEVFPLFIPAARQLAILDAAHFPEDAHGYSLAEKARSAYPDDPDVSRSLGILSYYQLQYSRSADLLKENIAKGRTDGELYYCLGMDYYQLKQYKDSKLALERSLALKIPEKLAAQAKQTLAALK